MDDSPSVVQCVLFGALALLALLPLVSIVCKSTALRECAAEWGWWRCVAWWDKIFGSPSTDADDLEADARANNQPRTIAEYYQMLYAPRHTALHHPGLALGLTTWREDVRHYVAVRDVFDMKLQQIQVHDQGMERYEPPEVPHEQQRGRDTMLCGDDEEEEKGDEA